MLCGLASLIVGVGAVVFFERRRNAVLRFEHRAKTRRLGFGTVTWTVPGDPGPVLPLALLAGLGLFVVAWVPTLLFGLWLILPTLRELVSQARVITTFGIALGTASLVLAPIVAVVRSRAGRAAQALRLHFEQHRIVADRVLAAHDFDDAVLKAGIGRDATAIAWEDVRSITFDRASARLVVVHAAGVLPYGPLDVVQADQILERAQQRLQLPTNDLDVASRAQIEALGRQASRT